MEIIKSGHNPVNPMMCAVDALRPNNGGGDGGGYCPAKKPCGLKRWF